MENKVNGQYIGEEEGMRKRGKGDTTYRLEHTIIQKIWEIGVRMNGKDESKRGGYKEEYRER